MGLDMYLRASKYISPHQPAASINEKPVALRVAEVINSPYPVTMVQTEAAYWRKANAIHGWFVRNIQRDIDDCQPYVVRLDQLRDLYDVVCAVLNDNQKAEALLPPTPGFFFGSEEIDDSYYADLKHTKEKLETILAADNSGFLFEYQSSW